MQSLRIRLILTHILPLLLTIPLMGLVLIYLLETQFVLPNLAVNLAGDARLLSEISRSEFELWGNPVFFGRMLDRVQMDPSLQVMFLAPDGTVLYSSDPADDRFLGARLESPGLAQAQSGKESLLTNYFPLRLNNTLIDVLYPVFDPTDNVVGIVRLTYQVASLYELFSQFRNLIAGVVIFGLLIGGLLGLALALNIGNPVRRVTQAIQELARGGWSAPLPEQGPREVRDLTRAVNHLVEQLRSLEQSRKHLLANLVHELGRPLGALRSAIHALAGGASRDAQLLADLTQGMDEETARLQRLLEDVTHLYGQTLGRLELSLESLALSEWLPRILLPWQAAAQEKNLTWQVDISPDLPIIQADPARLTQVVGNLLSNAIQYTPSGKSVWVAAAPAEGGIAIQVRDDGLGISPEEQVKIFTPFYRGDQGRRIKQGMGLGLSIANDLAVAHGGKITLSSQPGQGSSFTLWLPA
jgi:signal transduction histidine kinase